ncbi:hypothetical protein HAX54_013279 [Datura stramonium]|uniref:Uncharacterized protein n=1 Tax=Datura stramonium TaxID=4076 RepID=A0ABS8TL29_DATST|nr:hypothetical protein [Datura stramonium]
MKLLRKMMRLWEVGMTLWKKIMRFREKTGNSDGKGPPPCEASLPVPAHKRFGFFFKMQASIFLGDLEYGAVVYSSYYCLPNFNIDESTKRIKGKRKGGGGNGGQEVGGVNDVKRDIRG